MLVKLAPNKILITNPDTKITMSNNGTFLAPKLYIKLRRKYASNKAIDSLGIFNKIINDTTIIKHCSTKKYW